MHNRRLFSLLIIIAPLAILLVTSLGFLANMSRDAMSRLPDLVRTMATEQINGSVEIGDIRVSPSHGVVISNIFITGEGAKGQKPVVRIPRITVKCDLVDLLVNQKDPMTSIEMIDIEKPYVSVNRINDGSWDISSLIKPSSGKGQAKFSGKVQVRSASVTVSDKSEKSVGNGKTEVNRFSDVNAIIDLSDTRNAKFDIWGDGQQGKLDSVFIDGVYNYQAKSSTINIDLRNAKASYWSNYPFYSGLRITDGSANGKVNLHKANQNSPMRYSVSAILDDASLDFHQLKAPITNINGNIEIQKNVVGIDIRARFGSSPLSVSGYVMDFKKPHMALDVKSDAVNYREAVRLTPYAQTFRNVKLPSSGKLSAAVIGTPGSPGIKFDVAAPSAAFGFISSDSILVNGIYADHKFSIDKAVGKLYGGSIALSGDIEISKKSSVLLDGKVSSVKFRDIPQFRQSGFSASSSGAVQLEWHPGDFKVRYNGDIDNAVYQNLRFDKSTISAVYDNGTYRIDQLATGLFGGMMAASGEIKPEGVLDLQVSGTDVNLAAVRKMFWKAPTVGIGQFAGRITGNYRSPIYDGFIEAYKVVVSGIEIERISGDLIADKKHVDLKDLTVYDYPGTVSIAGRITDPLAKHPSVNLYVKGDSLDVDRLTSYMGPLGVSGGMLSADFTVSGPMANPDTKGSLHLAGITYHDIPLDTIDTVLQYKDKTIGLDDLSIKFGNAVLSAKGTLAQDKTMNIEINGTDMPLDLVSKYLEPYAAAKGTVNIAGSITGTVNSPVAGLSFKSSGLMLNNQSYTSLDGKLDFDKKLYSLTDFTLADLQSQYKISRLTYTPDEKVFNIDAVLQNGQAGKLLSLLDYSPYVRQSGESNKQIHNILTRIPRPFKANMSASLSGDVRLIDKKLVPNLDISMDVDNLAYGISTIESLRLKGGLHDEVIRLDELEAIDGDTNVSANAVFGPADELALQMDIHNLSTSALKQWVKLPENFSGKADVTIVADGSMRKPSTQMYLEIVDPIISGVKFDRLRSRLSSVGAEPGTVTVDGLDSIDRINIDELTLVLGDNDFRASGYIPVDWHGLTLRKDSPILLESTIDNDTLKFMSAFSSLNVETEPGGRFEGSIKLAGSIIDPKLSGILAWRDGKIRVPRLNHPLSIDQADIALSGNKLSIEKFSGRSALGGTFDIGGNITLAGMKPVLDLGIKSYGLQLAGRDFTNMYGEEVNARLDSNLQITGDLKSPLISGNIGFFDSSLSLSGKPVKAVAQSVRYIDPRFNVNISLGKDVRFKSSRLRVPLYGDISVNGSLSKLSVDGGIDISDGTILFPMRAFKLEPGSRLDIHLKPYQPPVVLLDIQGQTRLTTMSPLGQQKRYNVTMAAKGTLDKLNTTFESSPPGLSQESIVALLTGQRQLEQIFSKNGNGDLGRDLSGLFSSAMLPSVIAPIERVFQDVLGFEEFTLELGYHEPLQVTISERLWDGVNLSYTAFLGSRPDYADSLYEFTLSKRFKGGFELGIVNKQDKSISLLAEGKIRF
ncbi:MAG: translocation/assembly module TamB domain-containing protein [Armatimonadota bacterium]